MKHCEEDNSGIGRSYSSNIGLEEYGVEEGQTRDVGREYIMGACMPYQGTEPHLFSNGEPLKYFEKGRNGGGR